MGVARGVARPGQGNGFMASAAPAARLGTDAMCVETAGVCEVSACEAGAREAGACEAGVGEEAANAGGNRWK